MTRYAVAFGSNLGDRPAHLRAAVEEIGRISEVERVSSLYETAPIGGPEQDPYLNAVVVVESSLEPIDCFANSNPSRPVDIGGATFAGGPAPWISTSSPWTRARSTPRLLTVPHPRAAERRFVLEPMCDVWPKADRRKRHDCGPGKRSGCRPSGGSSGSEVGDPQSRGPGRYWVIAQIHASSWFSQSR